jgi:hypothetical protein
MLLVAAGAAALLPFATQAPDYVARQYADFAGTLRRAGDPSETLRYPDLVWGLRSLGLPLPPVAALALRAVAALAVLGLCLRLRSRLAPFPAALGLFTLAAAYLVLFNPRTEHNSYALLGPALGLFAGHAWLVLRRPWFAAAHALAALALFPPSGARPFLALAFLALVGLHLSRLPGAPTTPAAPPRRPA